MERLKQSSPKIVEFLMEFCGVKGEHFTKLGSEGGGCGDNGKAKGSTSDDKKIREMGPLEKKALDKHKKMQKENVFEIDSEVSSILANDELRSILLDPQMQQIMEECSTGSKLSATNYGRMFYGE